MKKAWKLSSLQLKQLEAIKRFLAERGYAIYPVAPQHRRRDSDFLAISKATPERAMRVRGTPKNKISIATFQARVNYLYEIESLKLAMFRRFQTKNIILSKWDTLADSPEKWESYISKKYIDEIYHFASNGFWQHT